MIKLQTSLSKSRIQVAIAWPICLVVLALLLVSCTAAPQATPPDRLRITIEVDGKQVPAQVPPGTTAQGALDQAGITLNNLDRVEPPSYTILAAGDTVAVTRVRESFTLQESTIPFEQQTVPNEALPEDQRLLVQRGVNGVRQETSRQVFENDKEVSTSVIKTEVLVEPLPEIIMVGVQKPFTPVPIPGRLVYLSSGNAWVMEKTTGNRRPVVTTGDLDGRVFALSPKGEWLLFTRGSNGKPGEKINSLWAVDITEEGSKPVNLKVDNIINFAGWVPGKGLTIVYSTVEPVTTSPGWQANNDLQMLIFSATGAIAKQETIIETNAGGLYGWWGSSFAWSPDGALLAYTRPDGVGLVNLETKTQETLATIIPFRTGSDWAWVPEISWAPDGSVLYIVTHGESSGTDPEASPVFHLSAIPMGDTPPSSSGPLIQMEDGTGMFATPVTSPTLPGTGFWVAFLQSRNPAQTDSKRYTLEVMDRDGSNRKTIFPPPDSQGMDVQQVAWSPVLFDDGSPWLAVRYLGNLWLVNAETGQSQQITGDGQISRFDWK
jgi:resuscitation-promoting factor RpfB